jgi:two-component sensor histidine kinase
MCHGRWAGRLCKQELDHVFDEVWASTMSGRAQRTLGARIMENVIGQLRGEVRFDWRENGLTCEIVLLLA